MEQSEEDSKPLQPRLWAGPVVWLSVGAHHTHSRGQWLMPWGSQAWGLEGSSSAELSVWWGCRQLSCLSLHLPFWSSLPCPSVLGFTFLRWEELKLCCTFHACVVTLKCLLRMSPHNCSTTLHHPCVGGVGCQFLGKHGAPPPTPTHRKEGQAGLACPCLHNQGGKGSVWGEAVALWNRQGSGQETVPVPSLARSSGERSWESFLGSCFPNCQCSAELRGVSVVLLLFPFCRAAWNLRGCWRPSGGMELFFVNPLRAGGSTYCPWLCPHHTVSKTPVSVNCHELRLLWTSRGLPRTLL